MEEVSQLRAFTLWWNNSFLLDYWYRKKNNISFNSKEHRDLEPISILFEWEEQQIQILLDNRKIMEQRAEEYQKDSRWLVEQGQSKDFYENLDSDFFEQFDD